MTEPLLKRRKSWIAVLLSFLSIPASYLYAGRPKRALGVTCLWMGLLPAFMILACKLPMSREAILFAMALAVAFPILIAVDIFQITRHSQAAVLRPYQRWWVYLLTFMLSFIAIHVIFFLNRTFAAEAFIIPTQSMAPALNYNDRIIVDKLFFDAANLRRHDLGVFLNSKPNPATHVKRIVGLPGETIEIRDEKLFVDGVEVQDSYRDLDEAIVSPPELSNWGPTVIPQRSYFVLGDNRRISLDSRIDGPIPFENFIGVVRLTYWSNHYKFPKDHREPPIAEGIRWDRIGSRFDQH